MDFYQEQHSYTLARSSANIDTDSDEETSWVMLNHEGDVVKLPGEKIYYKVRSRIALDISTPKSLPGATPFSIKSDSGIVYITNNRVGRARLLVLRFALCALRSALCACFAPCFPLANGAVGDLPACQTNRDLPVLFGADPGL